MTTPTNSIDYARSATKWFGSQIKDLDATTRKIISRANMGRAVVDDPNRRLDASTTFGERLADKVASFGGSWTFIVLFMVVLACWVILNSTVLAGAAFDPYPFIFLNLILSMLAAIQAPVIMMSQNRQSSTDRQMATYDYEVNLKAEVEIMALHEKLDALRSDQIMKMLSQQQTQIDLLVRVLEAKEPPASTV